MLELAGVLAGTFDLEHHALHLTSHVISIAGNHTMVILIGANVVTIIVIGLFASALATSRRNALRQTEITAWPVPALRLTCQRPRDSEENWSARIAEASLCQRYVRRAESRT